MTSDYTQPARQGKFQHLFERLLSLWRLPNMVRSNQSQLNASLEALAANQVVMMNEIIALREDISILASTQSNTFNDIQANKEETSPV
jgi:hypothetical protein